MQRGFVYLIIICFAMLLFLNISNLLAENNAQKPFVYDPGERRDPFQPLVTKDGKIAFGYGVVRSAGDIRLEGVVYDPEGVSVVIINGLVLKKNDTFGNIKVIGINADGVTLLFNQKEYVFNISE